MFELLIEPTPEKYQEFAEDYYEVPVDLAAVRHLYEGRALTGDVVASLQADVTLEALKEDVDAIGYPLAMPGAF